MNTLAATKEIAPTITTIRIADPTNPTSRPELGAGSAVGGLDPIGADASGPTGEPGSVAPATTPGLAVAPRLGTTEPSGSVGAADPVGGVVGSDDAPAGTVGVAVVGGVEDPL